MQQKIITGTIELNGEKLNIYLCDRKKECKNSINCGVECTQTFDEKHAALYEE